MINPPSDLATHATPEDVEAARRRALCDSHRADAVSYDWSRIGFGIMLAGGAYPVVLCVIAAMLGVGALAWSFVTGASDWAGFESVATGTFILVMYAIGGALVGVAWSGLVTVVTLPVIYTFGHTLGVRENVVWLGAFAGGLVGFIAVLPWTIRLPGIFASGGVWSAVAAAAIGPGLATVLGQLGGAWGGHKSRSHGTDLYWESYLVDTARSGQASDMAVSSESAEFQPLPMARIQFSIRQLLWAAVWLSLMLTLIRLCGIPFELMLPLLICWLLFQWMMLEVGWRMVHRIAPWWAARRLARST